MNDNYLAKFPNLLAFAKKKIEISNLIILYYNEKNWDKNTQGSEPIIKEMWSWYLFYYYYFFKSAAVWKEGCILADKA